MAGLTGPPEWVILGAPKAGTTSLAAWLGKHPRAYLPAVKEISYFDLHFSKGRDWYADQFVASPPGALRGDATPAYLYSDAALDRLHGANPDARLLVLLREPVDRMWSHHAYNQALGLEPRSFERAIAKERKDPTNAPYGLPVGYFACSRYVDRLEAITRRFPREQLLVMLFDELRASPQSVFDKACAHLSLESVPVPEQGRARNAGRQPRSALLQHALMRGRAGRWPLQLGPRITRLNARPGGYPPIPEQIGRELRAEFRGDNRRLAQWLRRPLPDDWVT